jgi:hypothetical protein
MRKKKAKRERKVRRVLFDVSDRTSMKRTIRNRNIHSFHNLYIHLLHPMMFFPLRRYRILLFHFGCIGCYRCMMMSHSMMTLLRGKGGTMTNQHHQFQKTLLDKTHR